MENKLFKNKKKGFTRTPKFGVTPKGGGFTLVETLVAISIFTVSLLGLMSVLASGVANVTYAKNKITAEYLAQEGIEYMRNLRDTEVLYDVGGAPAGWSAFKTKLTGASCQLANGCYFGDLSSASFTNPAPSQAMKGIAVTACSTGTCPSLKYDPTTGIYGYSSGGASGFIRKITATIDANTNEVVIVSTVSWSKGSSSYNVSFSEDLFNWIE